MNNHIYIIGGYHLNELRSEWQEKTTISIVWFYSLTSDGQWENNCHWHKKWYKPIIWFENRCDHQENSPEAIWVNGMCWQENNFGWLVGFYAISTFVGYLMSNPF